MHSRLPDALSTASDHRRLTRRRFLWISSVSVGGFLVGCAVNPVTGKQELMLISPQQEVQMDRQSSPHQFSTDYGPVQDNALNQYITSVGQKMIPHTHRRQMPYNYRVVNATYVNAYAFPGGSIAATRGILLKMENEAELAALLGHEMGHVNARHSAAQMSKGQLTQLVVGGAQAFIGAKYSESAANIAGQLGMLGASMLLASYSRDDEREADALGNEYMVKAGYSTTGMVGLMEMLNSMNRSQPGYAQVLFSTHPMSSERYQTAIQTAQTTYAASKSAPLNRDRYMDNIAGVRRIENAIEKMQKADVAMNRKQFPQAESLLQQALRQTPQDYTALVMMAKCQLYQNDFADAERYARDAQRVYPTEAQANHVLGYAKLQRGQYSQAYQEFVQFDRKLPGNPNTTFFKGYCHEKMGRRQQAAADYQKYLQSVQSGQQAQHAYNRLVEWGYVSPRS